MEATIEIEFLQGNNEQVIKELAVASNGALQTFLFTAPYHMEAHGSEENGLNWGDGYVPYDSLYTVLSEALAVYDHLYAKGVEKCRLLNSILGRPIHSYDDIGCPNPQELKSNVHCNLPCHSFPHIRCAARDARALHSWLQYHLQTKEYIQCPPNHTRHTAQFSSGVPKPNTVM
jgi:hypothetical protein